MIPIFNSNYFYLRVPEIFSMSFYTVKNAFMFCAILHAIKIGKEHNITLSSICNTIAHVFANECITSIFMHTFLTPTER